MGKFRDLHNENWPILGRWYTFDPSYLSPEDQNEYNKAVTFLNQYSAKLNKINDELYKLLETMIMQLKQLSRPALP